MRTYFIAIFPGDLSSFSAAAGNLAEDLAHVLALAGQALDLDPYPYLILFPLVAWIKLKKLILFEEEESKTTSLPSLGFGLSFPWLDIANRPRDRESDREKGESDGMEFLGLSIPSSARE